MFFFFLLQNAEAQMLSSYVRDQSGTLPKGRFLVSMVTLNSSIDSMYGADGISKTLSSNLNQNVSFQAIADQDSQRTNQLSGLFGANGVAMSDSAGEMRGTISGSISGKVPVLGYGVEEDFGIYLSIPVLNFQIKSDYQFTKSASANQFLSQLDATDQASVSRQFNIALNTSLENKLYRAGYNWDPNLNRTYLGDIQINAVKLIGDQSEGEFRQTLQPSVILPTANDQDIHDLYGLKAGDRRLGMGFKYAVEKSFGGKLKANFSLGGSYLFANEQARRIPKDSYDQINELLDSNVHVAGGAKAQTQASLRYTFPKWVAVNAGLNWQKKQRESLEGSSYSSDLYEVASGRTESELFSAFASVDLNSISSFLEGHFLFPASAELGVGLPLKGKYAISEPVIEFQGTMFF